MPRTSIADLNALNDPDELVECPCGFRAAMRVMRNPHRRMAARYKWPQCEGRLIHHGIPFTAAPPEPSLPPTPTPSPPQESLPPPPTERFPGALYVWPGRDSEDPEEIARRYNQERLPPTAGPPVNGNGHLPPGVLVQEPLGGTPAVSRERMTITLPVEVKVFYDGAREQGWNVGNGSLDAWVEDYLLTHLGVCMDLGVFMAYKSEMGLK